MKQPGGQRLLIVCGVIVILALSYWYGSGTENPVGRFGAEWDAAVSQKLGGEGEAVSAAGSSGDAVAALTSDGGRESRNVDNAADRPAASKEGDEKEGAASSNPFHWIVMHIKQVGRSVTSAGKGKNIQNNKTAQKNAEKATDKAQKKKKSVKKNKKDRTADNGGARREQDAEREAHAGTTENGDKKTVTCTLTISCASLLDNMDKLPEEKKKLVPEDGVLLNAAPVTVKQGSTVFDVLKECAKDNHLHLEYSLTPAFKNYYVEGIGNIYAFDAGTSSGWMFSVNNVFSGYSCSACTVAEGDDIKWIYTCNFGKDAGTYVEE